MALVLLVWISLIGDFYLFATGQLSLPTATLIYAVVTYMSYTPCMRPCTAIFTVLIIDSSGSMIFVGTWSRL